MPAALLAVGAVLAWRNRWALSGAVLGLGALVKWTPGLTAVVLVAWLLASRRGRDAIAHAGSFAAVVLLAYLPFLVWDHERRVARVLAPERPVDHAGVGVVSAAAPVRPRARSHAPLVRCRCAGLGRRARCRVAGGSAAGARGRRGGRPRRAFVQRSRSPPWRPRSSCSTNRIFSPQFVIVLFAAWAVAGALVVGTRREQLAVGVAAALVSARERVRVPVRASALCGDVGDLLRSAVLRRACVDRVARAPRGYRRITARGFGSSGPSAAPGVSPCASLIT